MHKYIALFSILAHIQVYTISIVYNFKIAQITKQPILDHIKSKNNTLIALLFNQYQKKYNHVHQNFTGGLGGYIYNHKPYYFRVDGAVSHIHEGLHKVTTFSGTETDDLLFTGGRNFIINKNSLMTVSGLFGIPTHTLNQLQHVEFGYSQIGLGAQWDGSYNFNDIDGFFYGARYVYFIPRDTYDKFRKKHTFTLGNMIDVLAAGKHNWGNHGLEYGYTARFQFGAHIFPNLADIIKKSDRIRSNFYLVYKYNFLINDIQNRVLLNITYSFDHNPTIFSNKYIVTLWGSWNINF